jgi:hypothetical protein
MESEKGEGGEWRVRRVGREMGGREIPYSMQPKQTQMTRFLVKGIVF